MHLRFQFFARLSLSAVFMGSLSCGYADDGTSFIAEGMTVEQRPAVANTTSSVFLDDMTGQNILASMWTPAGPTGMMPTAHVYHGAAVLTNGKVLVAGGLSAVGVFSSAAQIYDPVANTWTSVASMAKTRLSPALVALPNSRAMAISGFDGTSESATTEIYDVATGTWTAGPSLPISYFACRGITLQDNRVMVVGQENGVAGSMEVAIFNPTNMMWTLAAPMSTRRVDPTITLLSNGRVLVAGGAPDIVNAELKSAEIYNPATSTWTTITPMSTARMAHTATLLPNGKVLVAGGTRGIASAEIYDPATNLWTPAGSMSLPRGYATATLLPSGQVLVAGGENKAVATNTADLFDPTAGTWTATVAMVGSRALHTASLVGSQVLVAGGTTHGELNSLDDSLATAEVFNGADVLGSACNAATDCPGGFCVDGVCCNSACNAGPCDACSIAAGAAINGTCTLLTGAACDDGNGCTATDSCQLGVCVGANPVVCPMPNACQEQGACNPVNSICSYPNKPNGTACSDGSCVDGKCELTSTGGAGGTGGSGGAGGTGESGGSGGANSGGSGEPNPEGCNCRTTASGSAPNALAFTMLAFAIASYRKRTRRY